jgi:hypothetical protein
MATLGTGNIVQIVIQGQDQTGPASKSAFWLGPVESAAIKAFYSNSNKAQ